jgi:nitrite reductase/ring-hydroxylating ferredoxin subunit
MNLSPTDPTRREWVKQFILGTAAVLCGSGASSPLFAEVLSTGPGPGVLRIKSSSFPALANPGGSVQLLFINYIAPLTLNRVSADRFITLDSVCTHAGCTVGRFIVSSNSMRCPCHGSRYDIEGRVFRDAAGNSTEPAGDDLGRYETRFDATSGIVSIVIPDLSLHIESISVPQQGENGRLRLKLVFPATYGAVYEINYQPDLNTPPQVIKYSTTATDLANKSTVGPEASGNFTAYVDATGSWGFFSVGVVLIDIP